MGRVEPVSTPLPRSTLRVPGSARGHPLPGGAGLGSAKGSGWRASWGGNVGRALRAKRTGLRGDLGGMPNAGCEFSVSKRELIRWPWSLPGHSLAPLGGARAGRYHGAALWPPRL